VAITTLQGLADGILPGRPIGNFGGFTSPVIPPYCKFILPNGFPSGSEFPGSTATNGVVMTKNTQGALPFANPTSGNTYLAGMKWPHGTTVIVTLVDFLWSKQVPDKSVIAPQTIDSLTFPPRDINGTTNGDGVFVALTVGSSNTTGSGVIEISYTNQAGAAGQTGNAVWLLSNPVATSFYPFSLQNGDTGVRSIQTVTISSGFTGIGLMYLVAYRPIAIIASNNSGTGEPMDDAITFGMPRIYDDSCLTFIYHGGSSILGEVRYAQG
jgi:hypothetical protein